MKIKFIHSRPWWHTDVGTSDGMDETWTYFSNLPPWLFTFMTRINELLGHKP